MKTVYEIMQEKNADLNRAEFAIRQTWPYEAKVRHARRMVDNFHNEICYVQNRNVRVSVGGLDSITLFVFIRDFCHLDVPGISISCLEDKSVQEVHKQLGIKAITIDPETLPIVQELRAELEAKKIEAEALRMAASSLKMHLKKLKRSVKKMGDYIERSKAAELLCEMICGSDRALCVSACKNCRQQRMLELYEIPAASVREDVRARWEYDELGCYCTDCHEYAVDVDGVPHETEYCPECGARMIGVSK